MEKVFEIPTFELPEVELTTQDDLPETNDELITDVEVEEEEVEDTTETSDDTTDAEFVSPTYNYYKDNNFFEGIEHEEPKTEEEFLSLLDKRAEVVEDRMLDEIHKGYLSSFPEYLQPVLEAVQKLPENNKLSKEQFEELITATTPSALTVDSFSDENIAEKYIVDNYKGLGLDDDSISDIVATLKDAKGLTKAAKGMFDKDVTANKSTVNKFLQTADSIVKTEEAKKQQFEQVFSTSLNDLGWRDDRKNFIIKSYTTGDFEKRLAHMKANPKMSPFLIDFVSKYDGQNLDLDSYSKQIGSKATKKVKKQMNSYFKKGVTGSSAKKESSNLDNFSLNSFSLVER